MARILILEPDNLLAGSLRSYFANANHTAYAHSDPQAALVTADKHKADIVITNLQLAGRSGIEFLYEFRSYPEWQSTPVIVYSYVPERELDHAATLYRELGVVRVLYKPKTSLAMLCDVVGQVGSVTAS